MITTLATRTPAAYREGALDSIQLFELIDQHNALVEDCHDFCILLDADTGVTDTDYEDTLTAAEIDHSGYTTAVASPAPVQGLFGEFPVGVITEELAQKFTVEVDAAITDFNAIVAKLTADVGTVVGTNAVKLASRLVQRCTAANAAVAQDSINVIHKINGYRASHPHHGHLLAVGAPDTGLAGKVLRSTDDGRSWHVLATLDTSIVSVVAMVQWDDELFIFANEAADTALWRSTDMGRSWAEVAAYQTAWTTSTAVTDAIQIPGTDIILAAGGAGGEVLRSPDGGVSWEEVTITGPTVTNSLAYVPSNGEVMACGDDAILYVSADQGASFAAENDFSAGNPTDCRRFLEIANGYWLVTTFVTAGVDELQVSQDKGATWEAPVAVTGAQDELDKLIQGPDGTIYFAVGADAQISDDNGATVEAAAVGPIFPANDTVVAGFGKNRYGEVLVGTTNATDFAGIWLTGVQLPQPADAYGVADLTGGPLLDQYGGGVSGRWLQWARTQYGRLLEAWQAFGAYADDDATVNTTTYEAAIAGSWLTVDRPEPEYQGHNIGHGAGA